ncbi:MAG TPA: hypothetical protein VGM98_07065 [Schlesneria sp.]|jgi:hypothetical protein
MKVTETVAMVRTAIRDGQPVATKQKTLQQSPSQNDGQLCHASIAQPILRRFDGIRWAAPQ